MKVIRILLVFCLVLAALTPARADNDEQRYLELYRSGRITRAEYDTLMKGLHAQRKGCGLWAVVGGGVLLYGAYRGADAAWDAIQRHRKNQILDRPAEKPDDGGMMQFFTAKFPQGMELEEAVARNLVNRLDMRNDLVGTRRRAALLRRLQQEVWSQDPYEDRCGFYDVDRLTAWDGKGGEDEYVARERKYFEQRQADRAALKRLPALYTAPFPQGLALPAETAQTLLKNRKREGASPFENVLRQQFLTRREAASPHEIKMLIKELGLKDAPSAIRQVEYNLEGERTVETWVTFATAAWPEGLGLPENEARQLAERHIIGSSNRLNLTAWARRYFVERRTGASTAPDKQKVADFFNAVFAKSQKEFDVLVPKP